MSNKLIKNKTQKEKVKVDPSVINENDPAFIKLLKQRLQAQAKNDRKKNFFSSSILYFIIELVLLYIAQRMLMSNPELVQFYFSMVIACLLFSTYNIIVSLVQIIKYDFRKIGNIVLILMHLIIISMGTILIL